MRVFEANSVLWGGPYNFILPLFKRVPGRYKKPYQKEIKAAALVQGLVEAFQPDLIVELKVGSSAFLKFPKGRTITFDQLLGRDDHGACNYGVDLRTIISDLYETTFRFVERHPPEVVIPSCSTLDTPFFTLRFLGRYLRKVRLGIFRSVSAYGAACARGNHGKG